METSKNIYLGDCGIGAVKTDSQVGGKEHGAKRIAFAPARAAFLGLLRINLWGMASVLAQTAFEVDKATTDSQSAPNYWWDVGARWRNGWYNLGGSWSSFVKAVLKGKNRKPLFVVFAPRSIKNKLKAKGITGGVGIGVVDPATLTTIGTAAAIISALTPLLLGTINLLQAGKAGRAAAGGTTEYVDEFGNPITDFNVSTDPNAGGGSGNGDGRNEGFVDGTFFTNPDGSLTTAGYGTIGVSVLALLYLGTRKKGKKLF